MPSKIYTSNVLPPTGVFVSVSIQQAFVGLLGLAFTILIFSKSNLSSLETTEHMQLILLAYAIGCVLQFFTTKYIGSGYQLLPLSAAIYVHPSILALSVGGLPLLIGMTLFAGICEVFFARIINKLRHFFPVEICGLAIFLVGIELAKSGFNELIQVRDINHYFVIFATFVPMMVLSIWAVGYLKHLASIIGVFTGSLLAFMITPVDISHLSEAQSFIAMPPVGNIFQHEFSFNTVVLYQ